MFLSLYKKNFYLIYILAIFLFFVNLMYWFSIIIDAIYPDEIIQYLAVDRGTFLGAIFYNWHSSSIGRPGGVLWIDLWMQFIKLINLNNVYGFYLYRFVTFFFMIVALCFFIKFLFNELSKKVSFLVGNFFFFLYCNVTTIENFSAVYGVDLSIYGINFVYYLIIIVCLLRIYNNKLNNKLIFSYFIFLFIYLNSSYTHLIIVPFLVVFGLFSNNEIKNYIFFPKKFFLQIKISFKKKFTFNKFNILIISVIIYIFSVVLNLFSPSLSVREKIWPNSISFIEGAKNSLPTVEWLIFYVWGYKYLVILFVSLILTLKFNFYKKFNYYYLLTIILNAPIIAFFTNALTFLSPSLHTSRAIYPDEKLFFFNYLIEIEGSGAINGLAPRHFFYLNHIAIISYIFLGILIATILKKNEFVKKNII
jgi:hypothetical protein